jgi:pimeloyl-ACP methyl ester carboxylesterase
MSEGYKTLEHLGCKLAYCMTGDGPPVLMIQGAGMHGDGWLPQVNGLSDRFRCLRFDNRGMGKSQPQRVPLTIEQMAEDARVLIDAQGWERVHVVGHSMGGLIAQHFAISQPSRVKSLALLCTFARGTEATAPRSSMVWLGLRTFVGTKRMRRRAFLEMVFPPDYLRDVDRDALAEQMAPLFGHDLASHPPVMRKQLAAIGRYDATPNLAKLSGIRTLVISARHDPIARPCAGKAIAAGILGARYVEFPDASHGAPIQCAKGINDLLIEHFAARE